MAKVRIFTTKHFRNISRRGILEKLSHRRDYLFLDYKGHKPSTSAYARLHYEHQSVFPVGYQLWDGRRVIINVADYHIVQAKDEERAYEIFNANIILIDMIKILGESPSINVRRASKNRGFSATYDNLTEYESYSTKYGHVERTRLIIRPPEILEDKL